jgi:hypothetical protein
MRGSVAVVSTPTVYLTYDFFGHYLQQFEMTSLNEIQGRLALITGASGG